MNNLVLTSFPRLICCATIAAFCQFAVADDANKIAFFEAKIRPLLVEHCYECHSKESGESEGEFLLDSAASILHGGTMGPGLVPGKPDGSLIYKAVTYKDKNLKMPPSGKLDDQSIGLIREWIAIGAPDSRKGGPVEEKTSPLKRDPKSHWAFVTPSTPSGPEDVSSSAKDVIDAHAEQAARMNGLRLNEPATKETLVRRLYFDLTGLPPTFDQINDFVQDSHPAAYTRLVDQLLATPAFGERFGRHWLDVARYADTVGYALGGKEREIKGSFRYRDWVIRSFCADMPYDEMIRHQIAGDRTDPKNESGNLDAMGFLTVGRRFLNSLDTLDDQIDVVSRGLLGLTVSCARCHDHKFDPIPTTDYYSLFGIMSNNDRPKDGPSPLMMVDKKKTHDSPVLVRGQAGNRGPIAPRQFLTSLRTPNEKRFTDGSGRKELAERIVADGNPLTARVLVNRVWGNLIGRPLVESPSDFGFRTKPPAVPELLEELSAEFASHWSIKKIVRRIVLSRIYRQSSEATEEAIRKDADNQFLARANRRRQDFEAMRDAVLVVSNSLEQKVGGESVEITLSSPTPRRTIYAKIDRQNLPALFRTFDFASPDTHSPKRYFTTVPQQALYLMNSPQVHELARRTADVVRRYSIEKKIEIVRAVFMQILAREPSAGEREMAKQFLMKSSTPVPEHLEPRRLWSYGTADTDENFRPKNFNPFATFHNTSWQVINKLPADGPLGYAHLSSKNAHTPRGKFRAVVRRWTSPLDGNVRVLGELGHPSKDGDGIQASVFIGNKRVFNARQAHGNRPYGPVMAKIKKGEFVDFVATPGDTDSFDSFFWTMKIKLVSSDVSIEADSIKDFAGPGGQKPIPALDRLEQLTQILLISNEFAFID